MRHVDPWDRKQGSLTKFLYWGIQASFFVTEAVYGVFRPKPRYRQIILSDGGFSILTVQNNYKMFEIHDTRPTSAISLSCNNIMRKKELSNMNYRI